MQQHDGPGRDVAGDARQHLVGPAVHAVEAARTPGHARQAVPFQRQSHERVGHAHHAAVPARCLPGDRGEDGLGAADLVFHGGRPQPPEARIGVIGAVVADAMAAVADGLDPRRMRPRPFAHQEERGPGPVAIQQFQHRIGVVGGPVVDGQPDHPLGRRQPRQGRAEQGGARMQRGRHHHQMGGHHHRQADLPAEPPPQAGHAHLRQHQQAQYQAGTARRTMQCSCRAHAP